MSDRTIQHEVNVSDSYIAAFDTILNKEDSFLFSGLAELSDKDGNRMKDSIEIVLQCKNSP